nr:PKD domain-containing protein [Nocardioides glacieisoli]
MTAISATPLDWTQGRAATGAGVQTRLAVTANDPDAQPLTFEWNFTDGATVGTGTGSATTYRWPTGPGSYRDRLATVIVRDSCGASSSASLPLWVSGDPTLDFAPQVQLHPDEKWWPMSANRFVKRSKLAYIEEMPRGLPDRREILASVGKVSSKRLGRGGYTYKETSLFGKSIISSDDPTRPYDNATSRSKKSGFYLDLKDADRPGTPTGPWPAYLQVKKDKLVYWLFYGFSQPVLGSGRPSPLGHEGDWERIIVDLNDQMVPSRLGYVAHHEPVSYAPYLGAYRAADPASAQNRGLAGMGYVAKLGHGTYPTAGVTFTCVAKLCLSDHRSQGGTTWMVRDLVVDVEGEGWFGRAKDHATCPGNRKACGFGGAWGHRGSLADLTGPSGPSAYKSPTKN